MLLCNKKSSPVVSCSEWKDDYKPPESVPPKPSESESEPTGLNVMQPTLDASYRSPPKTQELIPAPPQNISVQVISFHWHFLKVKIL